MNSPVPTTSTSLQNSSITCREVLNFLMAYLDNELGPEQRDEFERHLSICRSCMNYLNTYKATVQLGKTAMQNLDEAATGSVPDGLIKAVLEARLKRI